MSALTCVIFQVTELCTGGELFDRIIAKTESAEGHYSETDAANIVHKILGCVRGLTAQCRHSYSNPHFVAEKTPSAPVKIPRLVLAH